VIVVDTSVWIDFLRGADTRAARTLWLLLEGRHDVVTTEIVAVELLAGAPEEKVDAYRTLLDGFPMLPLLGRADFEAAAELYRACRDGGETVRELPDCLIAVPAIRAGAPVLHADADFDKLARHTPLEVVPLA
jgi:predicted nucleic acid-binding protein